MSANTRIKDRYSKIAKDGDLIQCKDSKDYSHYIYEVYWHQEYQWSKRLTSNNQFMGSLTDCQFIVPEEMKWEIIQKS